MKRLITIISGILVAGPVWAQTAPPAAPQAQAPATTPGAQISGSIVTGVQQFDVNTNSSKATEYRDLRDQFFVPQVRFLADDRSTGWFFGLSGTNVARDDQTISARTGRVGVFDLQANWVGVPHNFSNRAVTPYIRRGPGLYEVGANIPISFKKLATTTAADAAQVVAMDELVAAYQQQFLQPTDLATQSNFGNFALAWTGSDVATLAVAYNRKEQRGQKWTFGPIGDRPPRSLNIQLPEPVDYRTNEVLLSAERLGNRYEFRAEYLFSDFANDIDTLTWENVWATPATPGATFDVWDRSVSTFGRRPLPPDNRYHNASVAFGADLPWSSRFNVNAAYGRLEQNTTLLPYSYNVDVLAVRTLPRQTADAQMNTVNVNADYVLNPFDRLNIRAFFRHFDLDNKTPSSQWQYVTQDTANLTGTVAYVNKRVNIPYAWDRQNVGAEATWRLLPRSSLILGAEYEGVDRVHREANTAETVLRAGWRTRVARGLTFDVRYRHGMRDADEYHNEVTHEGYWYALSEATDNNNPRLTFDNHPDMRRYDVTDRLRRQFDARVNLTPNDVWSLSAYARYRNDDYDSDVTPSQPLLETTVAERLASSPGDQLGLLEDTRTRYGADLFIQPGPRVSFNAFVAYDFGDSFERSLEFNENNKANPSAINTAELGPWTRRGSQWTADMEDRTWSGGVGATFQLVPNGAALSADYTLSMARYAVDYQGFGRVNWDGTPFPPNHQFFFTSPPDVKEDLHMVNLRLEVPIRRTTLIVGYTYEDYSLSDWQQEGIGPWVERVGGLETLLRDTSRSFQWGNRLFNMGSPLAPGYGAHIGFVGLMTRF